VPATLALVGAVLVAGVAAEGIAVSRRGGAR
jgi:hypothetical protein